MQMLEFKEFNMAFILKVSLNISYLIAVLDFFVKRSPF